MNEFSIIIAIVTLIVSILQIVLFFKLWKMTNDVLTLKETVDKLLYSKLPDEKRKHDAFVEVFEMLWFRNIIKVDKLPSSEPEKTEELTKQVSSITDRNKRMFIRILEKHLVSDLYSIEKLKEDIINHYQKKIAEL